MFQLQFSKALEFAAKSMGLGGFLVFFPILYHEKVLQYDMAPFKVGRLWFVRAGGDRGSQFKLVCRALLCSKIT